MQASTDTDLPASAPESPIVVEKKQLPILFPPNLAEKIIWSSPFEDPTSKEDAAIIPTLPTTLVFPDGILSEVQAAASYAFSQPVQMATLNVPGLLPNTTVHPITGSSGCPEPIISLYYPRDGCHNVIDAMVKSLAREQGSDVVVLDSIDLALGEFGIFGKEAAQAINAIYTTSSWDDSSAREEKTEGHDTTQQVINDIVNIRRDSSAPQGDTNLTEQSLKSRIIYVRDSGAIARSVKPLLPYLVQALRVRRTAKFDEGLHDCEAPIQPTILILGFAETDAEDDDGYPSWSSRRRRHRGSDDGQEHICQGFTEGGEALKKILPSLDSTLFTLRNGCLPQISPISAAFFFSTLTDQGNALRTDRLDSKPDVAPVTDFTSFAVNLSIFPKDSHTNEFRKVEERMACRRRQEVLNAWMVVCLGKKGGVCENPLDSIQPTTPIEGEKSTTTPVEGKESTTIPVEGEESTTTPVQGEECITTTPPDTAVVLDDQSKPTECTTTPTESEACITTTPPDTATVLDDQSKPTECITTPIEGEECITTTPPDTVVVLDEQSKSTECTTTPMEGEECITTTPPDAPIALDGQSKPAECITTPMEGEKCTTTPPDTAIVLDEKSKSSECTTNPTEGEECTTTTPSDTPVVLDGLSKPADSHLLTLLDQIATIAIGLAPSQPSGSTASRQVTPSIVSQAYRLFIENSKTRSDWLKTVKKNEEESKEKPDDSDSEVDEDEKSSDPIAKVKAARDLNSYERRLLDCIVDTDKLPTTFGDVCIPKNIIESLRTIVSLRLLHPAAFSIGILQREAIGGILLYGPPGTGKTLACRALARECGARMLELKSSDILDCYLGESEKLAKSIFSLAYRLAPCVIFIDEMDSLFKARTGKDDRPWVRNILNEFLQGMDGLQTAQKNKDSGIVIVGATNRPQDLDDAVLRRLPSRMLVDLPGEPEREQILRVHLKGETLGEGVDLASLARKTTFYSGSDLKNFCVSAAMASVKEAVGHIDWTPAVPNSDTDKNIELQIQNRKITQAHFTHALNEVFPSSLAGSHSELQQWHDKFCGRKKPFENSNYQGRPQTNGAYETARTATFDGTGTGSQGGNMNGFQRSTDAPIGRFSWQKQKPAEITPPH